ncbi:MAG: undecaprenyl-diphosphate phosphatase [Acidobacteriota bacterium]
MIGWLQALVLGALQGATEYLPVSSSGHLVIAEHLFGLHEPTLFFNIVLHVGTLSAVFVYYRRDLMELVQETLAGARDLIAGRPAAAVLSDRPAFRLALLILVGTIPTAAIGLLFTETFEALFGSVFWTGVMLTLTGTVLFLTRWAPEQSARRLGIVTALVIGVVQGLAIAPGISRSGTTIATALFFGVGREEAARFSFLLSIPSILGALLIESGGASNAVGAAALIVGFLVAAASGYFCLALLVQMVKKNRLSLFSYYCWALGLLVIFLLR